MKLRSNKNFYVRVLLLFSCMIGLVMIMCLGIFSGCENSFATNCVSVSIKAEYKEKFISHEFTIADFNWKNVERIEYGTWHSTNESEIGFLTIYLKKHGKDEVNEAIKHFDALCFVHSVEKIGKTQIYQPMEASTIR